MIVGTFATINQWVIGGYINSPQKLTNQRDSITVVYTVVYSSLLKWRAMPARGIANSIALQMCKKSDLNSAIATHK